MSEHGRLRRPVDIGIQHADLDGEDGTDSLANLHRQTKAKILVLTGSRDVALFDGAVLAGARVVVDKRGATPILLKAIERAHVGEFWIDRNAPGTGFQKQPEADTAGSVAASPWPTRHTTP